MSVDDVQSQFPSAAPPDAISSADASGAGDSVSPLSGDRGVNNRTDFRVLYVDDTFLTAMGLLPRGLGRMLLEDCMRNSLDGQKRTVTEQQSTEQPPLRL